MIKVGDFIKRIHSYGMNKQRGKIMKYILIEES